MRLTREKKYVENMERKKTVVLFVIKQIIASLQHEHQRSVDVKIKNF